MSLLVQLLGVKMRRFSVATEDVPLCQQAYCMITGVALRTLQRYIMQAVNGVGPADRGRRAFSESAKTSGARVWFQAYVNVHDRMPNASRNGMTEVSIGGSVTALMSLLYSLLIGSVPPRPLHQGLPRRMVLLFY